MPPPRKDTTGQDRATHPAPSENSGESDGGAVVFHHALLRTARLELGVSQEEMARSLGIDVRTYRRYESGEVNSEKGFEVRRNASRRQLLRKMCDELGVEDEEAWLVPMVVTRPLLRSHALLRANHFVGRDDLLRVLKEWADARGSEAGIFAIVGVGGAGKTAVVERFVASLKKEAWVHSFYDDARTEPVVNELASSGPNIVVLDGVEAVQSSGTSGRAFGEIEDASLRRALRAVCSGIVKRKVIVTSRFPLSDFAAWEGNALTSHALAPLAESDSIALLRAWGMRGDDAALSSIAERSGGHALSIAMTGSYVGTFLGGNANAAATEIPEGAEGDDAATRRLSVVLDSYASALSPRERDVTARLSIFAGAADVELLAEVCEIDPNEVMTIVARLERLGLVAKTPQGITAHPFVRDRFKRMLGVTEKEMHATIGQAISARLEGKPDAYVKEEELLDRYEELFIHTLRAGRELQAYGIYARALGGYANLGLRLGAMARGARVLQEFGREGEPEEARASILYDRGLYACALGDLAVARRMHDAHIALVASSSAAMAMGLRTRAYVAWVSGDLEEARAFVRRSLDAAKEIADVFHIVRAHSLEAIVAHDQGDEEGATRALEAAHALEDRPTARRAFWEAEILRARGDHDAARKLAERAVLECARRGWIGHVAHGHTVLGMLANDDAEAAEHLERARPWVVASNEIEMSLRCELLAARIDERAPARGLALAEAHGFKTFARRFRSLQQQQQQQTLNQNRH